VKDEVSGVEVQAVEGEFGKAEGLGSNGGQDGVALGEEGVVFADRKVQRRADRKVQRS
jgi:hypothetical protein